MSLPLEGTIKPAWLVEWSCSEAHMFLMNVAVLTES